MELLRDVTGDDIVRLTDEIKKLIAVIKMNTLARERANNFL